MKNKIIGMLGSILVLLVWQADLTACDMMALISINGQTISGQLENPDVYNDPDDFFDFLKARSDSTLNNDGYGVIYYRENEVTFDSTQICYKTGRNTWYGDGEAEPLDAAIESIMDSTNNAVILLGHDRNGSTGLGSHPFIFDWNDRSFIFMHNGTVSSDIKEAFMNYLGEDWFDQHPSQWSGEYGTLNSFIDSELMFHYIMSFIIDNGGDVVSGIRQALNQYDIGGFSIPDEFSDGIPVINFIMSDGEKLYLFRNFYINGTTKNLSYEIYDSGFVGIKTQESLENQVPPNTLVVFSHNEEPVHYDYFQAQYATQVVHGYLPLEISFTDLSDGDPVNWSWDFQNDGIYDSYEQNPVFVYDSVGIYDVKLMIDTGAVIDSLTKLDYITVFDTIPPAVPENLQVEIDENDALLEWDAVETNIYGLPADVDFYIIYNCIDPVNEFSLTGYTEFTNYTDKNVNDNNISMFYQIEAFIGSQLELERLIRKYRKTPQYDDQIER